MDLHSVNNNASLGIGLGVAAQWDVAQLLRALALRLALGRNLLQHQQQVGQPRHHADQAAERFVVGEQLRHRAEGRLHQRLDVRS